MCSVWLSGQTVNFALYIIKRMAFITEVENVYCAVRNESLYNTDTSRSCRVNITWINVRYEAVSFLLQIGVPVTCLYLSFSNVTATEHNIKIPKCQFSFVFVSYGLQCSRALWEVCILALQTLRKLSWGRCLIDLISNGLIKVNRIAMY